MLNLLRNIQSWWREMNRRATLREADKLDRTADRYLLIATQLREQANKSQAQATANRMILKRQVEELKDLINEISNKHPWCDPELDDRIYRAFNRKEP